MRFSLGDSVDLREQGSCHHYLDLDLPTNINVHTSNIPRAKNRATDPGRGDTDPLAP
jgi:hypothetical protein